MPSKEMSKDSLRKEFGNDYKNYYSVKLFEQEGFTRKKCKICGKNFWSIEDRDICGEPAHKPYSFFKEKPNSISYSDFWRKFADFFKKNGHEVVDRYPVVSRWRQDLYFTIASIQDFQRIENGKMSFEYGANPLIVPQICLRFGDIANVGVTGRHFTSFMMAGQHAFNYPKEGYWRDRTIELNYKMLTEIVGVKKEDLIYHEDVWAMPDFSEFGPCLESFANGLELVNSVFTQFEYVNGQTRELEAKVVDVGWGFDARLLWFYTGYDSAFQAVFKKSIAKMANETGIDFDSELFGRFSRFAGGLNSDEVKNLKQEMQRILKETKISEKDYITKIKPIQAMYAVADHVRTLLFALSDGALPSNLGGGYNLRMILRRSLDFINEYKIKPDIDIIAELIAEEFKDINPELKDAIGLFRKVTEIEKEKYERTKENAKRSVEILLQKSNKIGIGELRTLYESNGVTPDLIEQIAEEKKVRVELPENYYADLIVGDLVKKEVDKGLDVKLPEKLESTKQLYYDFITESKAKVLFSDGKYVVLDKTPFYPEGGGQVADTGFIEDSEVVDAQKINGIIVHVLANAHAFKNGAIVDAKVDARRRGMIIAHHTATHLMSAAARQILGKHAWQEGAKKEPEKAHIDVAHYEKLSPDDVQNLEELVNGWIRNGIKVKSEEMNRGDAERQFGFAIYQGHGVPAKTMRIVTIRSLDGKFIDAQACGGLHAVGIEHAMGIVKIISTYKKQDGVDRIEYVAGEASLKRFRNEHNILVNATQQLNSEMPDINLKIEDMKENMKKMVKEAEKNSIVIADAIADAYKDADIVERELDMPSELLIKIANRIVEKNPNSVVVLRNNDKQVVCIAGSKSGKSAVTTLKALSKNFKGGGNERFAAGIIG